MPIIPTPPISGSPPPIHSAVMRDWSGGINYDFDDSQLAANESIDMLDVDTTQRGGFQRRASIRSLGDDGLDSTVTPKFLYHFPSSDDNGWILVGGQTAAGHDSVAYWATGDISDGHAKTNIRAFASDDAAPLHTWSGFLMNRVHDASDPQVYIHRKYNSPVQTFQTDGTLHSVLTDAYGNYNDTDTAVGGTMPHAEVGCAHLDYAFHADCYENSVRQEYRVRYSWAGHPGDYRTDDYIDVGSGQDNDRVTAMVSAYNALFIFKKYSVWVLEGFDTNTFSLTKIASGVGTPNKNGACFSAAHGVTFFDAHLGMQSIQIQRTAGGRMWTVVPMWGKLQQAIQDGRITNMNLVSVAAAGSRLYVSGLIWNGASQPNRTWYTDALIGPGWYVYSVGFKLISAYTDSTGISYLMGAAPFTNEGGASATHYNYVAVQQGLSTALSDVLGSTTVTYNGHLTTAWITGGDSALKKRFRRFSMTFDAMANTKSFAVSSYRNWNFSAPPVRTFTVTATGAPTSADFGQQNNVRSGALGSAYAVCLTITGPNDVAWGVNILTFRFIPQRIV